MATTITNGAAPPSLMNLFNRVEIGVNHKSPDMCQRCSQRVYQVEKVGPVNNTIFHKQCFKCKICTQHLTMKTYYRNQVDLTDKEIYCVNHTPKNVASGLDHRAIGIRGPLDAQKARDRVSEASARSVAPNIGPDAIGIRGAIDAQNQFQRKYKQRNDKHHFPAYVVNKKKEEIRQAQEKLELELRSQEDALIRGFLKEREHEAERLKRENEEEWERKLKDLTERFDKENKTKKRGDKASTYRFEEEKNELYKNMTVKMKQKKDAMTIRLQQKEQKVTADLVSKQSQIMLEMLQNEQTKIKEEFAMEIHEAKDDTDSQDESIDSAVVLEEAFIALNLPRSEPPPPHPPQSRKRELYNYDEPSKVFADLDEDVFSIAEKDQSSFTELVQQLTQHCETDLQKARAIFRWITVKDLNQLEFDESMQQDTPMGLLRGIKYGTETYHTLFMRLCSYAGLPCVEIKGHSKSVGYEPGMKIREDTFQNTWNAVLIHGDWWPVQCNWGARHLVLNKDILDKPVNDSQGKSSKKQDKIRYQYDEHYFLTDPDEFIQEFWAQDPKWQLLEAPISLEQFESMPFVRSVFFHYGLEFERTQKAVLHTDDKGGCEVKIRVPDEFARDLVFHYQIRFADRERRNDTEFRGAKLERFVFHSLAEGFALFSVHVPTAAAYFLEIFANRIDDTNKIGDDPNATMLPFRLKCACKYKVICDELVGKMHPLPNCASGEWGPSKGRRHFELQPSTHISGVVSFDNEAEIRFKLPRKLHFLCKLRMNGVEEHLLERYVTHSVYEHTLTILVRPPQPGQYGLDVYARPEDAADNHTLAHACKYLLNCTRVNDPIDIPVSKVESSTKMSKDKWGPSHWFDELGLKALSHRDSKVELNELPTVLTIEIGLTEPLKLSYHLIREPDEDSRDKVALRENGKRAKFNISLNKAGNYMFAIYARRKKDSDANMLNVFNYMIRFSSDIRDDTLKKSKSKSKGLFKK